MKILLIGHFLFANINKDDLTYYFCNDIYFFVLGIKSIKISTFIDDDLSFNTNVWTFPISDHYLID